MSKPKEFQRARRPEQKEGRKQHLLNTARTVLLHELDANTLSLNELARLAGMTKSNVYRYYESREAVLLDLLDEELDLWRADLKDRLVQPLAPSRAIEELATIYAATLARRPLLCCLTSILPSIIEHNITLERVLESKRRYPVLMEEIANVVAAAVSTIKPEQVAEFARLTTPLLIGLWPISHPSSVVRQALSSPELIPLRFDFEADLAHSLTVILKGILAR